jgi:hypothetical protein
MVAVPQTATNKLSGKQIKSKNQYKREKAKLKKATAGQESTPVRITAKSAKWVSLTALVSL